MSEGAREIPPSAACGRIAVVGLGSSVSVTIDWFRHLIYEPTFTQWKVHGVRGLGLLTEAVEYLRKILAAHAA